MKIQVVPPESVALTVEFTQEELDVLSEDVARLSNELKGEASLVVPGIYHLVVGLLTKADK